MHPVATLWKQNQWLMILCFAVSCCIASNGREIVLGQQAEFDFQKQTVDSQSSLRGLCVVDSDVVWATGSKGAILRCVDGKNWELLGLPGRSDVEIRDVFAWDARHALVMIAGQPAEFWETRDGGQQWKRVFVDGRDIAFYDDILIDPKTGDGVAFGDVVANAIPLVFRLPTGQWQIQEDLVDLSGVSHLHGYAASGTSMVRLDDGRYAIGTGGASEDQKNSIVLLSQADNARRWTKCVCPMEASESAGIFSLATDGNRVVAVGGDYLKPDGRESAAAYSTDGGQHWQAADQMPAGYRSGVARVNGKGESAVYVCVGTNGSDVSNDGGRTWNQLNGLNLNAVRFTASGNVGWAVGGDGAIYRIENGKSQ